MKQRVEQENGTSHLSCNIYIFHTPANFEKDDISMLTAVCNQLPEENVFVPL